MLPLKLVLSGRGLGRTNLAGRGFESVPTAQPEKQVEKHRNNSSFFCSGIRPSKGKEKS